MLAGVGDSLVSSTSSTPGVVSYATSKLNGQKGLVLINSDPANAALVQVTISGSPVGASAMQYSYGIGTSQPSNVLAGTAFAIPGATFTVSVPAYTATELIIQ